MKTFSKHYLAVVIAAACPLVFADDLYEVVVTASPFATSTANNHPVDVLSGDTLQNAASATLGETLNGQLGVNSASFGPGVGLPIIRGQSDNRVKVMQDSVGSMDASSASPDHAVTLEPLLATKIEVLRGPAALRYGSGAIGGVVNVLDNRIPSKLTDGLTGGAEIRASSVNDETNGVVNLNDSLGQFAIHADAIKRDSADLNIPGDAVKGGGPYSTKGYIANTDAQYRAGTLGTSLISDDGFVGASVNRLDNNYGVPPDSAQRVRIDMHQTRYDLKAEYNNPIEGFEKISAHLGHADYQHTEMEDGVPGTQFTNDAYEGRMELIQKPSGDWQGAFGVQAARSTFAALGEEAFIPKSDIASTGLFILEETHIKALTFELGARGDRQDITPVNGEKISHNSVNLSSTSTWNINESHQVTFGLARSQRAPSVEELLANGPHPATGSYLKGNATMHEETSNNIELGYQWHSDELQWSLNGFYNHIIDFIYAKNIHQIIDSLNSYEYTQANATFKGFESELKIPLNKSWKLRLFADSVRAALDSGGDLPRITPPRIGADISFEHTQWGGNLIATRTSQQQHPGDNESASDGYTRIDARLSYAIENGSNNYQVFLKGTNLLNADIRNASSYLRNIAPEGGRGLQLGVRAIF